MRPLRNLALALLQVTALEGGYPGGVTAYVKNARELLRSSAAGENPFDGMKPEVRPAAVRDRLM